MIACMIAKKFYLNQKIFLTLPQITLEENDGLFEFFKNSGSVYARTLSTETNIHSHLNGGLFSSIVYSGKMMITDPSGGIGVTFLSKYPSKDRYYRLRRFGSGKYAPFHLSSHGGAGCNGEYADITPKANEWYSFEIITSVVKESTPIYVSVWPSKGSKPTQPQISCVDTSDLRIKEGTIGMWAMESGEKYWGNIRLSFSPFEDNDLPEIDLPGTDSNTIPVASNMDLHVDEDIKINQTLQALDLDGDSLTYVIKIDPKLGSIKNFDSETGNFEYTPIKNAFGVDSFTFSVSDGKSESADATVNIVISPVNDLPITQNIEFNIVSGQPLSSQLIAQDVDSNDLTYLITSGPSFGTLEITNSLTGEFTYTSESGPDRVDTFQYIANDGEGNSNISTVTINLSEDSPNTNTKSITLV